MSKTQKTWVKEFVQITILTITTLTLLWCSLAYHSHYTVKATVTQINDDLITVCDTNDNVWSFYGNGYTEGNIIRMTMDSNNTTELKDDRIINAKIIEKQNVINSLQTVNRQ